MALKMTQKQQALARTYKKMGYSEPELLENGNAVVYKRTENGGRVAQVIDRFGATLMTRSVSR